MELLASTIVSHIVDESATAGTFRYVLPSYPSRLLMTIGTSLEEHFAREVDRRVKLEFGIAYALGQEWGQTGDPQGAADLARARDKGWYNEENNLTSLRNRLRDEDAEDALVTVVAGYDHIPDRASLMDFFHLDDKAIWRSCMGRSFGGWVETAFAEVLDPHDHKSALERIAGLLSTVYAQGLADLPRVSVYLGALDLSGVFTGTDALRLVLGDLSAFGLPPMLGLARSRGRKSLRGYLSSAQEFANYSMFLEATRRSKAIKTIEQFRTSENRKDLEDDEGLGAFSSVDEMLDDLATYVETRSQEARKRLLTADFVYLHDDVLRYRPSIGNPKPREPRIRKLSGLPPEVFLRALWLTLGDYSKMATKGSFLPREELQGIVIESTRFRHDFEAGENQANSDAEREIARSFLTKAIGGIDALLEEQLQRSGQFWDAVPIKSRLAPSDQNSRLGYAKSSTAEPRLEFQVTLKQAGEKELKRRFYWSLPQTHQARLLVHLCDWALDGFERGGNALPAYAVPFMPEIYMARDESEVTRLVGVALASKHRHSIDLLDVTGISPQDSALAALKAISPPYQQLLRTFEEKGFFAALGGEYDDLRKSYVKACDIILEHPGQTSLIWPFLKAFHLVDAHGTGDEGWVWQSSLPSAIATPLHPAVLDMMRHQHAFLCESFCVEAGEALREPGGRRFAERAWDRIKDLARIERPLFGLMPTPSTLDTTVRSYGLIHLLGQCRPAPTEVISHLLVDSDVDGDDVTVSELFRETRASALVRNALLDYRKLHAHADDGLSIGAYCGKEIQPLIAGIDSYLREILSDREERLYGLQVTVFSTGQDDSSVTRWLDSWRKRWAEAELTPSKRHYASCRISTSYRVIGETESPRRFAQLLQDTPLDVMLFTDFVGMGESSLERVGSNPPTGDGFRQFPILDMSCCAIEGGGTNMQRKRIVSHRRFTVASRHSEVMARLLRGSIDATWRHMVVSTSDFVPWRGILDAAHQSCAWVVCVDPAIDELLLKETASADAGTREIIGFGTGVGAHGEANYTISTEQYALADIERRIGDQLVERMGQWDSSTRIQVAHHLVAAAASMSGLSVVKATGPSEYVRDYIAYAATRKLLKPEKGMFCDEVISLDAFHHWFNDGAESFRPDLLRLRARVVEGYLEIDAQIIECKVAQWSDSYLIKARDQVQAGLERLVPRFRPRQAGEILGIDDPPDQRYWWMQLHRLLASHGVAKRPGYAELLAAMERLAEGFFTIRWQGAVFALWTDADRDTLERETAWELQIENDGLVIPAYTSGYDILRRICLDGYAEDIFAGEAVLERASARPEPLIVAAGEPEEEQEVQQFAAGPTSDRIIPHDTKPPSFTRDSGAVTEAVVAQNPQGGEPQNTIAQRILLGQTLPGHRAVYWEFGHRELPNRHVLVFGASGTGKTYTIQAILCELSRLGQNSLIVDYTSGFTTNQMERLTREQLRPKQHTVRKEPLPINPFRRQCDQIDDMMLEEDPTHTAQRVVGVMSEVYQLGDQQKSALYTAIREGITECGDSLTLDGLLERLRDRREEGGPVAGSVASVISRIEPLVDMHPFGAQQEGHWEAMYTDGNARCHILQLAGFSKHMARLITEFSLIDLYRYYRSQGSQKRPRVIVLDEIQNLDHRLESPLGQLLTEGRKFGVSLIMATQTLSSLSHDERDRLFQASHKLFFKPADTELRSFAQILTDATGERSEEWIRRLSSLARGECYSIGPALSSPGGTLDMRRYAKVAIQSLEERFGLAASKLS